MDTDRVRKHRRSPFTFEEAKAEYERRIDHQSGKYEGVPLQNNTRLVKRGDGDAYAVKLHNTDVVTYHVGGEITLNMGGWDTMTTRDRINTYTPDVFRVYRRRGVTYVSAANSNHRSDSPVFEDGMKINQEGGIISGVAGSEKARAKRSLDRDVREYIRGFIEKIKTDSIDEPSQADCWMCCMKDEDGESMGDMGRNAHLVKHMDEEYYVPSLLANALDEHDREPREMLGVAIHGTEYERSLFADHRIKYALKKYFQQRKDDLLPFYREDAKAVA